MQLVNIADFKTRDPFVQKTRKQLINVILWNDNSYTDIRFSKDTTSTYRKQAL